MVYFIYICIKGWQVIIYQNIVFLSPKVDFVSENSADPDEMPQYAKVPM